MPVIDRLMPKLLFQEEGAVKYDFMSVTLNFKLDFFMKNKGESPKILINVMKKTFVQFIFSIIFVSISAANDSHAQGILNQKISLSLEDVTIKEVLQEIEEWMDVKFSYNSRKININERISISIKENELSEVLTNLFKKKNVNFELVGTRQVILTSGNEDYATQTLVKSNLVLTKNIIISGKVTNEQNEPLIGASVLLQGTTKGTTTDVDGGYSLEITEEEIKGVLLFSYVGYENKTSLIGLNTIINIVLKEGASLEEVVVVGYGTQKKVSLTGAVSSIKPNDLLKAPVSSVANALGGRTAGIISVQRTGEPGRDIGDIFIRGIATFAGGTSAGPLVLVDGVERSLAGIDPYTIESLNVLKDASATAVFGVRGANGVIIITTKTGEQGKPQFTFSSNLGVQNPIRLPKLLDAVGYAQLRNEAEANDLNNVNARKFSDWDIERFKIGDDPYFHPNINWFDYMLKERSPQQQYNLNVSGGMQNARYFVSLGFLNQDGAYKVGDLFKEFSANPNYKRYNIRTNFDFNLSKNLSLFIKASSEIQDANYANSATRDIFSTILSANPIMSPVIFDNKMIRNVEGLTAFQISNTPLYQMLFNGYNTNFGSRLNINIGGRYKLDNLVKGLSIRGMVAYDSYYLQTNRRTKQIPMYDLRRNPTAKSFQDSINPIAVVNQFEGPVIFNGESFVKNRKEYAEAAIEYNKNFNDHGITALVLGTAERYYDGGNQLPFNYLGVVSRATYQFKTKYFFDVNVGYNGSENFAKGKQFGFFPSFSTGYIVSSEPFFPKTKSISYLKFRGSYGIVGNDKIGGNRFLFTPSSFVSGGNYFLGLANTPLPGYREGTIGNPNVTWEQAKKLNIGTDFRIINDLISVSVDYFKEERNNILWNLNVPITFGAGNLISPYNIGVAENKGFEVEMGYRATAGKAVTYSINGNYTFARNKIVYMDETPQPFPGLAATGSRIGQLKGLLANGLFNTAEEIADPSRPKSVWEGAGLKPGDIRYVDVNEDGRIDDNDRVNIGNPNIPEIIYGLTTGIQWKGFELTIFLQGAENVSAYLTGEAVWPFIAGTKTAFENATERWTEERYLKGETISMPRLTASPEATKHNYRTSSFWMQDASYLRLKNVELAYTIGKSPLNKLGVKSFRMYINGQNLYTWTKMPFFDPEIANSNGAVYPMTRIFNAGFNLQF